MICKECGHRYRRQIWSKPGQKQAVWRCINRLKNGTKSCKHSATLREPSLEAAIMTAINSVVENHGEFVGAFRENVIRIIGNHSSKDIPTEYDARIEKLQAEILALIDQNAKNGAITEDFDEQYQRIAEKINKLKEKKLELVREWKQAENLRHRVADMDTGLEGTACEVREFDNDLVRRLLQRITVISEDTLEIQFKSEIILKQRIPLYE